MSDLSIPQQGSEGPVIQALFLKLRVQRRENLALNQKTYPTTNVSNSALFKAFWSMTPPKLLNVSVTWVGCCDISQLSPIAFHFLD